MKRVLVTNAGGRLGVGVSRALKRTPEQVHLIGVDAHEVHLQRAVTHEKHLVPRADQDDYWPVLKSVAEDTGADFLWPNHDGEIAVVASHAPGAEVATFLPPYQTVALCQDKMASNQCFGEAGVPVPESMMVHTRADLRRAFRNMGQRLWLRAIRGTGGKGSLPVSDFETANKWIDIHQGWGRFMAAQCLTLDTVTWESLWNRGELISCQGRRRLYWEFSSMTLSGVTGVGGAHRWVNDPIVSDLAIRAIKAVTDQPHGIFSVDMTYDHQGAPRVTEINSGRFMSGGVVCMSTLEHNFAYLGVQLGMGEVPYMAPPIINILAGDTLLVHGMDIEPVLVGSDEVDQCLRELQRRRQSLASGRGDGRAAA